MTIYTPSQVEKKPEKGSTEPEVVTEPLTSFKDEEDGVDVSARPPLVNYFQKRRRTFCIHLLLTIFILVILACGAIGAVVFYRHLNKKVYTGVCGNFYIGGDDTLNEPQKFVQEEVKVTGQLEELQVPRFEEVKPNVVLHDFYRNYTTIVDAESHNCYVMKLNRSLIAPPKDLIDLMEKLMAGYYQTKAKVIRENYRPVLPAVNDPIIFGSDINSKCYKYNTYRLEKYVPGGKYNTYWSLVTSTQSIRTIK
ncbi:integral membrane protein 2B [Biomphalaria pfeifferi]|uniref:Integral membrane protein 2 n=1 Tax=Biomphalaria pfeifferi TaxID=112525 RepID=A0AAD8BVY9_BIOPF|nr:integral membrane protein 2B [Biomphalaria pfeifferi]